MGTTRNIFLLICFFLIASGCEAQSDSLVALTPGELSPTDVFIEIKPTTLPTELAVPVNYLPTATARPNPNNLVTATPVPRIEIFPGVDVTEKLDFDYFVVDNGSSAISYRHANSVVEIKNSGDWDKIDAYSPFLIQEGEGVVFKFMLAPYSYRPRIFFETKTDNGTVLQWGIRPILFQETFVRRDYISLHERVLNGSLRVNQGEWYYLLLTVDKDADFRAVIWNPANPEVRNEIREQLPPEWFAMQWTPEIRIKSGQVNIDEYMKIVIDTVNE